jgi:hypothetical protein
MSHIGIITAWNYAWSVLTACFVLGVAIFLLDRKFGIKIYRFLYDFFHKDPMPSDVGQRWGGSRTPKFGARRRSFERITYGGRLLQRTKVGVSGFRRKLPVRGCSAQASRVEHDRAFQAKRVKHGVDRAFQAKRDGGARVGLDHGCVIGTRSRAVALDSQQETVVVGSLLRALAVRTAVPSIWHRLRKRRDGGVVATSPVNDRGQCTWWDERERRQEANVPFHLAFTLGDLRERPNAARCDAVDPGARLGYGEENRIPGSCLSVGLRLCRGLMQRINMTGCRRLRPILSAAASR